MSKFRQFINPHSHSDSSLDGASTVKQIIDRNIELGATYVSLTEHGNMNSAMELYTLCKKAKVAPILGIELYVEPPFKDKLQEEYKQHFEANGGTSEAKFDLKMKQQYVHVTVHFKDEWAYNYFCKLSPIMDSRSVTLYGERKPICTIEELRGAAGHITIGTACVYGFASRWILKDKLTGRAYRQWVEEAYLMLREIAGPGNFFVEIFPHEITCNWVHPVKNKETKKIEKAGYFEPFVKDEFYPDGDMQKIVNQVMRYLANKYNDPILISLDSHFALPEHKVIQDSKLGNGQEYHKQFVSYHIQSSDDAAETLKRTLGVNDETIQLWVDNSYKWAALFDNFKLPTSSDRWILQPLPENWQVELKRKIDRHGRMDWSDSAMVDRLKMEINILAYNGKLNLMPYFFTVEDIADYCRNNSILINLRGSGGGCLLAYLLGISAFNPLKHDLPFERFLTIGRIMANTLPDLDIDIPSASKDKVLDYLRDKYGDAFCQLSVDSMLRLKSSIKDAERSLFGKVSPLTEKVCKELPSSPQGVNERDWTFGYENEAGIHVVGLVESNVKLQKWIEQKPDVWNVASIMLGIQRQKSVHACGTVIADKPVQEYCPIITVSETKATAYSPKWSEMVGLVKYDLLGLNTLSDIESCLRSIKERTGEAIDPWNLPYDQLVFDAFCDGRTETVFQFNTQTVVPYLKSVQPRSIEDLAMITALCRPGTLDAPYGDGRTLAQVFVARRQGEFIRYIHADLEPILKGTLGIQIYQEISLRIFRDLAGYSYEKAETVRRGISKKDENVLRECMSDLKTACLKRGWSQDQVNLLSDQIMASARYSFNKSHAISYSYVAYACMYLKEKYPLDWWKACLTNATKDELAANFWKYVKDFTLLPDINKSKANFIIEDNKLRAPLSIITGVGPKTYEHLTKNAPYNNLEHFVNVHFGKHDGERSSLDTGLSHRLIAAGLLDSLFDDPTESIEKKIEIFDNYKEIAKGSNKNSPPPKMYIGITLLGKYLVKKELVKVYSEDLRPIMIPIRGGNCSSNGIWRLNKVPVLTLSQINKLKEDAGLGLGVAGVVSCLGYVFDEKIISYKEKTKQATKLFVDVGGDFFEEVLWPGYQEDIALSGFKGYPVLMNYNCTNTGVRLVSVLPLLQKHEIGNYSVI